jgi:hypothetical protein
MRSALALWAAFASAALLLENVKQKTSECWQGDSLAEHQRAG